MITITTLRGIINYAWVAPDDAESIKGNCGHGRSMFDECKPCELESVKEEADAFCLKIMRSYHEDQNTR